MAATQRVGWSEQLVWTLALHSIEAEWRVVRVVRLRQRATREEYLKPRESCVGWQKPPSEMMRWTTKASVEQGGFSRQE